MQKYHLIGIKGAGMSSLACLLHDFGYYVQGSDVSDYFFTEDRLRNRNITILPFDENNLKKDYTVIVGNAFIAKNSEYYKALSMECEVYTYYEFLSILSKDFYSIAVTGSHGKTTTTNLIRQILEYDKNINYLIGDGQGGGSFSSDLFVFEACEYQRHFLSYEPKVVVVTNVDFDHPDYYKDIFDVQSAIKSFMEKAQIVVYNGDDSLLKEIVPLNKLVISYGLNSENDYYAENITNDSNNTYFDLYYKEKYECRISIPLFGIHSVYNALAAIAACRIKQDNLYIIKERIAQYKSSKRRFEETKINDQIVISDYAHHPREIKATIEAVNSKYPYQKVIIYFQPHTYTRTISFLTDFASSLAHANKVYFREIFSSAREHDKVISVNDLCNLVQNSEVINDDSYLERFKKYKDVVIVFMGAGDIDRYCEKYIEYLKNN